MSLERRILSKAGKKQIDFEDFLIQIHELFCSEYGFINIEEFKRLPWNHIISMLEALKKRNSLMKKGK